MIGVGDVVRYDPDPIHSQMDLVDEISDIPLIVIGENGIFLNVVCSKYLIRRVYRECLKKMPLEKSQFKWCPKFFEGDTVYFRQPDYGDGPMVISSIYAAPRSKTYMYEVDKLPGFTFYEQALSK